jgi:MFS transporter, PPP family, 3-phenylpropionic acid transporter
MSPANRLRLFYFLYYGYVGAYLPFFSSYLQGLGFSGGQIGAVQMAAPLVSAPVALAWAGAADRLGSPARALRAATLWALGAMVLLPWARTPATVAAVILGNALGAAAVVPLVDSVTIEWVKGHPGATYSGVRLYGSLGFAGAALTVGLLLRFRGGRPADPLIPFAVVALVAGYALVARRMPSPPPPGERPHLRDALQLLRDPRLALVMLAGMLHWAGCAPFHILLGVHVHDLALPHSITGLCMAVAVGAEIAALLAFPRLEALLSTRGLFTVAFAGTALRWWLAARIRGAPALVAVQLLHACTFGLFWGSSVRALGVLVPARLRATGQALFGAVVFGAGNVIGYPLAGRGYDRYGSVGPLFGWAAALELFPLAASLVVLGRRPGRASPGGRPDGPGVD